MTERMQSNWLDAQPIKEAILEDAERALALHAATDLWKVGLLLLAQRIGKPERVLRRVLAQSRVTEQFVDEYCIATGRPFWDVYPCLYETPEAPEANAWEETCRYCGHTWARVLRESATRVHLSCYGCGRGRYVETPEAIEQKRENGRRGVRHFIDFEWVRREHWIHRRTLASIASDLGMSDGHLSRRLRQEGVPVRGNTDHLDPANGWDPKVVDSERKMLLVRARYAEGFTTAEIAGEMGISQTAVLNWRKRDHERTGTDYPLPQKRYRTRRAAA